MLTETPGIILAISNDDFFFFSLFAPAKTACLSLEAIDKT